MKKFFVAAFLAVAILFNTAAAENLQMDRTLNPDFKFERDKLYQVALLQSLTMGYFDGSISVKDLKTFGDTGIGTFEGLDGEMIFLDGVVYRANQNCKINVVKDDVLVPFANVAFFHLNEAGGGNMIRMYTKAKVEDGLNYPIAKNNPHMVKLEGEFSSITVRSEAKQKKPYPTIVEALQATQKEFTFKNIKGTIIGLYCPDFMSSVNTVGWHFHFISADKKVGGHVLEVDVENAHFTFEKFDDITLLVPMNKNFQDLNFKQDLKEDIRKAEQDSVRG